MLETALQSGGVLRAALARVRVYVTPMIAYTPPGYHGRYLRIDLAGGRACALPLAEEVLRCYLGGCGLGAWLLLTEDGATCEALSPPAPLCFVFSPLVGSPLTTSAKFAVVCKSPLTDRINDSLASSHFALAGKRTGYDAIVLVGQAQRPVVVVIDEADVRLEPAEDLWGLTCTQAERELRARFGAEFATAVIGPAGERLVRYATISHDGRHAGRGGSGAVLGAKRVKAVAVRGNRRCRWAHPEALAEYSRELSRRSFGPATAKYRELGTAANLLVFNRLYALPTLNFQQGSFAEAEQLAPEQLSVARSRTRKSCAACTIGCEHLYALDPGRSRGAGAIKAGDASSASKGSPGSVRVEYESLFALGSLCGVSDAQSVLAAIKQCDEQGLDTISAGATIAFAMECAERGLVDAPWLRFGRPDALARALDEICNRHGLGNLLAEGTRRAANALGGDAPSFAPHVKGLELPGYEPRALQTMALGLAVNARGADHNRSGAYEADFSGKVDRRNPGLQAAAFVVESENRAALIDSLILCKFLRSTLEDFYAECSHMLHLITGWDVAPLELHQTARRIVDARKLFNQRAGWQPQEDTLPPRLLEQPLPEDNQARLTREKLAELVRAYYHARGWSEHGTLPTDHAARDGPWSTSCNRP